MTPQELKNSILQLAIQGKLVPQRAKEGTAEELYNQIQAEKQKLIKAGKIKKEKPLPAITDDEKPFEIPDSWKWVRVGDLLQIIGGVSYKKTDITKQGIRILRGGNIQDFKVLFDEDDVFLPLTYQNEDKNVRVGDIIVVASTGSKNVIGKAAYVDAEVTNTMIGAFLRICRPYYIKIVDYLKYLFDSYYYREHIRNMVQGTNINNVKESYIAELLYPLPPLAEQKRIVAKIEKLLPYVERYEKAYNELQQLNKHFPDDLQKSVLQLAIQGRLVPQCPEEGNAEDLYKQIQAEKQNLIKAGKIKKEKPLPPITDDEKPFEIPGNWKWVRLGELCAVLTCGYASTPEYVSKDLGMPFLSAKNVKPYKFMPEDHKYIKRELYEKLIQNAKPEKGDILLTRVGAGIGEAAIIDKKLDFAIYVSLNLIKLINYNLVYNKYILFWLNSPIGISSTKSNIYGKNASQGNLNVKNVREFLVPLPTFAEQKRIVTKLEELLPLCNELK